MAALGAQCNVMR